MAVSILSDAYCVICDVKEAVRASASRTLVLETRSVQRQTINTGTAQPGDMADTTRYLAICVSVKDFESVFAPLLCSYR